MSIYATLWELKFPADGDAYTDCDWVAVFAQGVPAHIGTPTPGYGYESGDPYADFLPPAVSMPREDAGGFMRAVVIVREGTPKVGQRYTAPLLTLTGDEYRAARFDELRTRICDALRASRPRVVGEYVSPTGERRLIRETGEGQDT